MPDKTAVLIPSCDKYSDLWHPFFSLFWRCWPDCPFPVYLGTNEKTWSDPRVQSLAIGPDTTWCANLQAFLDRVSAQRIILFLDDFLLTQPVDSAYVQRMVRLAVDHQLGCLRLRPMRSIASAHKEGVSVVLRGEDYRISTQVAIWDVAFLRKLARPAFNIWEFEHIGTLLGDRIPGEVWSSPEYVIHYRHGVERGFWLEDGLAICRASGVEPDLSVRPSITEPERARRRYKRGVKWQVLSVLPASLRRSVRRFRPRPELGQYLKETS